MTDPRAVTSILKVFSTTGQAGDETGLLQLLTQIDNPSSSLALAKLAATTRSPSVRQATIDVLKTRPRRDYVGQLVSMIHSKIQHSIVPVNGPGSTGTLVLDTQRASHGLELRSPDRRPARPVLPRLRRVRRQWHAHDRQGAELENLSRQINPSWWSDKLGYSYESPPKVTIVQDGTPPLLPPPLYTTCFVAGTPVRTLDGARPIESIQVGDQVLSQDDTNGALAFRPVVNIHHNPPGKTLRLEFTHGESIGCSVYHRFWRPL